MKNWQSILPVLIAVLLVGCGTSTDDKNAGSEANATVLAPAAMPATAPIPKPSAPAPSDALATAAEAFAAEQSPLSLVDDGDEPPTRYFDVIDCNEEIRDIDPGGAEAPANELVARRVALLRRSLRLAGYSPVVIEGPLAEYFSRAVHASGDSAQQELGRLSTALETKRAASQPDLPPIRAEGGCGAAETPILVKTRPAGGRVWLITKFGFDLCRARLVNAWDRNVCDRWSEVSADRALRLSGNYVYQAKWPVGPPGRGNRRIDPVADDDDPEAPQTITVDQQ